MPDEIFHEFDVNGWLIGWHNDAGRPRSTPVAPDGIPPVRARFVAGAWVSDASRDIAAQVAAQRQGVAIELQRRLDGLAVSWGYDSMLSLASYRGSASLAFAAEALAATAWRDAVWIYAAASTATTPEAFFAGLPPAPAHP